MKNRYSSNLTKKLPIASVKGVSKERNMLSSEWRKRDMIPRENDNWSSIGMELNMF